MIRVAFLNIYSTIGGGEIYLQRLLGELLNDPIEDISISLITAPNRCFEEVQVDKNYIIGLTGKRNIKEFIFYFKSIIQINNIIKKSKIDLLVINGERAIYMAPFLFVRNKIGIKHMLIVTYFQYLLNLFSLFFISKIVTISNFHVNNLKKIIASKKIQLIYNSVDINSFKPQQKTSDSKIVFFEAASLEKRKGQLDLLKAFRILSLRYSNIELWFAGDGELFSIIVAYISENNLSDCVKLLGYRRDINNLLKEVDVVILPSYSEGFPLILLEAMSCKKPVISTRIAGIPEMVTDGKDGFLIESGDIEKLGERMEYFIKNVDKIESFGQKGQKKIVENFTSNIWKKKWENLILDQLLF